MRILLKRGSSKAISSYSGIAGELLYNVDTSRIHVCNGIQNKSVLTNIDDLNAFKTSYITNTSNQDKSWARTYNDGFMVQSNYIESSISLSKNYTISLLSPFQTTNYFVGLLKGFIGEWPEPAYASNFMVWNLTKSSFNIRLTGSNDSNALGKCRWIAFGY